MTNITITNVPDEAAARIGKTVDFDALRISVRRMPARRDTNGFTTQAAARLRKALSSPDNAASRTFESADAFLAHLRSLKR